jgi:large subunit ribosomal protein L22
MEATAKTKYLKGSPRKARLVIDLIRGRNVSQALAILKFTDKRAADPIAKCLNSAIANATYLAEQQNIAIDPDDLWVKSCFVDMGPTKNRRRMRPAPQGRAYREQRHYCHITINVSSDDQPAKNVKKAKPVAEPTPVVEEPKKAAPKAKAKKDAAPKSAKKEVKDETAAEAPAEVAAEAETPAENKD